MKSACASGWLAAVALVALPVAGSAAFAAPFAADDKAQVPSIPPTPARWWQVFADPELDRLMVRLDSDNTAIASATARLAGARAHAALDRAESGPRLGLSSSGNYAAGPLINAAGGSGGLFTAALAGSWEPDLLGRSAPSRRAEKAEIRAAEADKAATRLLVEVLAARAWFSAIAFGFAHSSAQDVLALARDNQAIAQAGLARGLSSRRQVDDRVAVVAAATERLSELARQETLARDALGYLVGKDRPVMPSTAHLPLPPPVPEGLPAGLIARRPDVAAAIARVEAADARHSAARRDWLPRFALTATGGTASTALSGLLTGGVGSVGLALVAALPGLDGGAHKARVAGAEAAAQFASIQLREAVLAAYRETGDALAGIAQTRTALAGEDSRDEIARTEAARTERAAQRGSLSRSARNDARIAELEAHGTRALRQLDTIDAALALVIALGGNWGV